MAETYLCDVCEQVALVQVVHELLLRRHQVVELGGLRVGPVDEGGEGHHHGGAVDALPARALLEAVQLQQQAPCSMSRRLRGRLVTVGSGLASSYELNRCAGPGGGGVLLFLRA